MMSKRMALLLANLERSRAFSFLDNRNAALDRGFDADAQDWYRQYRDAAAQARRYQILAEGPGWRRWVS